MARRTYIHTESSTHTLITIIPSSPPPQVRCQLEILIEGVQGTGDIGLVDGQSTDDGGCILRIAQAVTLTHRPAADGMQEHVVLEWEAGTSADMIADAIVAVILQVWLCGAWVCNGAGACMHGACVHGAHRHTHS